MHWLHVMIFSSKKKNVISRIQNQPPKEEKEREEMKHVIQKHIYHKNNLQGRTKAEKVKEINMKEQKIHQKENGIQ